MENIKEPPEAVQKLLEDIKRICSSSSEPGLIIVKPYRNDAYAKRDKYLDELGYGAAELVKTLAGLKVEDYLCTKVTDIGLKLYSFCLALPEGDFYFKFDIIISFFTSKECFGIISFHPMNDFFKEG